MPNNKDSAGIAQLVERNVANVKVAGSNPVSRSILSLIKRLKKGVYGI